MISLRESFRLLGFAALVSCAPPAQSARTVEVPDPSTSNPGEGGGFIAAGDGTQQTHESPVPQPAATVEPGTTGAGQNVPDSSGSQDPGIAPPSASGDREFVMSREPHKPAPQDIQSLPIHLNDSWWPFRAQRLGITVAEAKRRDLGFSSMVAPKDFWDEQTAVEAVSVWSVLCNECHGGRRSVEDALTMQVPAPGWGQGEGLFFGNRRAYKHAFDIVYNGGPKQNGKRSEMIAWKKELSREQIWSLLYFLEYQSGGIEGRFPPSLYPRRPEAISNQ